MSYREHRFGPHTRRVVDIAAAAGVTREATARLARRHGFPLSLEPGRDSRGRRRLMQSIGTGYAARLESLHRARVERWPAPPPARVVRARAAVRLGSPGAAPSRDSDDAEARAAAERSRRLVALWSGGATAVGAPLRRPEPSGLETSESTAPPPRTALQAFMDREAAAMAAWDRGAYGACSDGRREDGGGMTANWANQTVWTGDNLYIMRGMNSASVDLIYLDPPFNSKANYAAPIGSKAAGAAFKDTWTLSDVDAEWVNLMEAKHPALHRVLLAAMTPSDKSYLAYMAVRLLEMRRLLKPTGSIYLHCDPTMSHYLKLVMDAVFGRKAFRNEIAWQRTSSHNDGAQGRRQYGRVRDELLFYAPGDAWTWNPQHVPYNAEYVRKFYRHVERDTGRRYRLSDITGPGGSAKGNPYYEVMGVTRFWRYSEEEMKRLIDAGRIVQTAPGRVPAYKRYLDEMPGKPLQNIWTDIPPLAPAARERIGYPTQKPLALLSRVIAASSNEGDVVLDPFAGCATACIAAEQLGREWVGIDISEKAAELVERRMRDELGLFYQGAHRTDVPRRTDMGKLPPYRSHRQTLYGQQEGNCAGCASHFEARHLEVDHIISRRKGGTDHVDNLQLLCGSCNRVKGDRGMEYLRVKLQL